MFRPNFRYTHKIANKEITKLIKLDVIKPIGRGRSLSYQLKLG